jgi:tetratricopeptide (TPR) repeat protein
VGETQSRLLAHEALVVADQIFALGWLTQDPKRFAFAAIQYREALRHALLGKIELDAAELGLGRALLAAGDVEAATKALTELVERSEDTEAKKLLARLDDLPQKEEAQTSVGSKFLKKLVEEMPEVEKASLEMIATFLQEEVEKREAREDLWPEGRLQLGITYAALKDFEQARVRLDEVIRICQSGGRYMREQFQAA